MAISAEQIKTLRERTGISMMACKSALEEAGGDMDKALELLVARGASVASKKSGRTLGAGVVSAYVHANKSVGVLLELNCETDFVARNEEFVSLANDICLQTAAMGGVNVEEVLAQSFVKDPSVTVTQLIDSRIQKFGEKIVLTRFIRYELLK